MSLKAKHEEEYCIKDSQDFVTNIKHQKDTKLWIFVHQNHVIDVLVDSSLDSLCNDLQEKKTKQLHFQTNIYDAIFASDLKVLVSNRNMPVRLFSLKEDQKLLQWSSIVDKKLNSQQYLTPIQIAKCQDTIVGGGKKFVSRYDLNKNSVMLRFKEMNKRYVSAIELINRHTFMAGQFNGELTLLDIRSEQTATTFKPHLDLVTRIKVIPNESHRFITMARKDNYIYQWDCRMLQTFISYFQHPLYGNQRTGLDVDSSGETIFIGGQRGQITGISLKTGETVLNYSDSKRDCISSLCCQQQSLILAVGSRHFALQQEDSAESCIKRLSLLPEQNLDD